MLQTHTFKIIWSQTKHEPDTAPTTTQQSKPRVANPHVLQRTERLLEEGPAAVGVALKINKVNNQHIMEAATAAGLTQASEIPTRYITLGSAAKGYVLGMNMGVSILIYLDLIRCDSARPP